MKMMSVKTHRIIWDDGDREQVLQISTHPDNPEYVIIALINEKTHFIVSQMTLPLQVAKSFHMVLRDF
jgi:hypothetical protein